MYRNGSLFEQILDLKLHIIYKNYNIILGINIKHFNN